jgi:hypothetical protein
MNKVCSLLNFVFLKIQLAIKAVLTYLGFIESGSFLVTRAGEAQFSLKKEPKFVEVLFKDSGTLPCDPDSEDQLSYFIKPDDHKLVINWTVSTARTIVWTAYYF